MWKTIKDRGITKAVATSMFGNSQPDGLRKTPGLDSAFHHQGIREEVIVVVFLRGAADDLNLLVPFGEQRYYQLRPTLGVQLPDCNDIDKRAIDLDGFFGMHPA